MIRILSVFCCLLAAESAVAVTDWNEHRLNHAGLPNAFQVHTKVISGGTPEGDEGFQLLKQLGVKTIVSVDGAPPDLMAAEKFGLRYVHLPHGYDGIASSHARTLAKAVLTLPGPIYIHCHHGKHRSPAAAMVACVGAGLVDAQDHLAFLRVAGTNPKYVGLYAAVREARAFETVELNGVADSFPSVAKTPPLAKRMVDMDRLFDNLVLANRSKWNDDALDHKIDPAHDAMMLREQFAETLRALKKNERPKEFRQMLRASHVAASRLERLLSRGDSRTIETLSELSQQIKAIKTDCQRCHAKHRDSIVREEVGEKF